MQSPFYSDSASLYAACVQNGTDAQFDAFQQLWGYLYRIAYAMTRDRHDSEALSADCTQAALIKIHRNLAQCHEPTSFRSWAAQIVRRSVIDALRQPQYARRVSLPEAENMLASPPPSDAIDLSGMLRAAIEHGPLSERSRRVVVGRFFRERSDEELATEESQISGDAVLPSHVQVTRAKNLAKLRQDTVLLEQLRPYFSEY